MPFRIFHQLLAHLVPREAQKVSTSCRLRSVEHFLVRRNPTRRCQFRLEISSTGAFIKPSTISGTTININLSQTLKGTSKVSLNSPPRADFLRAIIRHSDVFSHRRSKSSCFLCTISLIWIFSVICLHRTKHFLACLATKGIDEEKVGWTRERMKNNFLYYISSLADERFSIWCPSTELSQPAAHPHQTRTPRHSGQIAIPLV